MAGPRGRMSLGQPLTHLEGYTVGSSGTGGGEYNKISTLYLPASTAGTPSLSPSYDSNYWTSTASAVRVVGRFGKKYNTGAQTYSDTNNNPHSRHLARQFVIPLSDIGIFHPNPNAFYFNLQASLAFYAWVGTNDCSIAIVAIVYIVDSNGTQRDPNDTLTGATISGTTLTKSGAFNSGDVGRAFIVENHDNLLHGGGPGVNFITSYINSSNVGIGDYFPGTGLSDTPGTNRTIRWLDDGHPDVMYFNSPDFFGTTVIPIGENFLTSGVATSYASLILPSDYLVIEVGYHPLPPSGNPSRSYKIDFRDDSDSIVVNNGSNTSGSTGALPFFSAWAPYLGISRP